MEATIEVNGLRKRFGPAIALDGMSFTVLPGQVTGFVGPNGAGKSTTMRVILGLDAAFPPNRHGYPIIIAVDSYATLPLCIRLIRAGLGTCSRAAGQAAKGPRPLDGQNAATRQARRHAHRADDAR